MMVFHYFKREVESLFVHRFSNATMPFARLGYNCTFYWLFGGIAIAYFLFHPQYTDPGHSTLAHVGYSGVYFATEILNGCCHLVLRNLRKPGTTERGIP